jgi:hypothetical protein
MDIISSDNTQASKFHQSAKKIHLNMVILYMMQMLRSACMPLLSYCLTRVYHTVYYNINKLNNCNLHLFRIKYKKH